ncbi:hypothetical protein BDV96DRAFT_181880 [Lophiotrema nucula]|uniref:Fungal N-terminal domain-containing protein n=1 Tax=Lophiotrema nucula TaxID=690887 RepID=A0A6A5YX10_9PLEO|nr:hypothetical protein BDV96DRAFT_181880 [Lophiotrema nucula]
MAEVIGLTASLITLAGTGAKLAGTLFKVANIIRSAECEARVLAADIQIFSASLTQLSKVLELSHPATNQLRDITVVLINACQALNEELNIRIGDPLPYTSKRRFFTMEMLSLRFRWLIHGEKVAFLKSLIDSFKFTTLLLVSTMDLATALHRHAPESIAESFKSQVESNIGFAERATQDLFQNESAKQSPQTDEAPSSSLVELPQRLQIQSVRSEANDALVMHDFGFKGDGAQLDERAAIVATTSGSTQIEVSNNRDRDNVDDYQLQLSHECSQIFEIHRMTERLAREVLSQTMPRTTWSWSSPASTQQPTMPSAVPGQNMAVIDQVSLPTKRTEVLSERLGIGKPIFQSRTKDTSSSEPPPPEPSTVAADYLDARVDEVKSNVQGAASRGLTTAPPPTAEDDDDDDIDELKHPSTVSTATASSSVIVEEFEDHGRYTEEVTKSSFQPGDQGRQLPNSDWLWHRKESRNRSPLDESRSFGSSWDQLPREDSKTIPTTPPMPPPQGSAEQAILEKLASMLSTEEKRRAQEADIARQKAENEKFSRLENLLIAQQTARIEKEQAKKEAAEMAALKAAEAKRKGDEDKLAKLEELILAQKEEQLKREAAIEAAARAEKAERDAKLAR